eukprot:scaffold262134_cov33-Tisochrysis_lutea.AAC.1
MSPGGRGELSASGESSHPTWRRDAEITRSRRTPSEIGRRDRRLQLPARRAPRRSVSRARLWSWSGRNTDVEPPHPPTTRPLVEPMNNFTPCPATHSAGWSLDRKYAYL